MSKLPDLMVTYFNHDLYATNVYLVNPKDTNPWYVTYSDYKVHCYCPQNNRWNTFDIVEAMEYKSPNMAYVFFRAGEDFDYY